MSNLLLPRTWWQELGGEFLLEMGTSKNARINAFTRNVSSINLENFFPHMVENKSLRENSTSILEKEIKP